MKSKTKRVVCPAASLMMCGALLQVIGCGGATSPVAIPGVPTGLNAAAPLLSSLGSAVPGLSQSQAILGAGSLLGLAKAKMPASQYSQISAIPGADALVGEAVQQGLPTDVTGRAGLAGFLSQSGISPNQINQMVPVLTGAVKGKVSPEVAGGFLAALQ
jgi:hypothetical protein